MDARDAEEAVRSAEHAEFYEVTVASIDQPKLLSQLSDALVRCLVCILVSYVCDYCITFSHTHKQGDMGLNICEAHAFNTNDRLVLDVFVVNGWQGGVWGGFGGVHAAVHA